MTVRMLLAHALHKSGLAGTSLNVVISLFIRRAASIPWAEIGDAEAMLFPLANGRAPQPQDIAANSASSSRPAGRRPVTAQEHARQAVSGFGRYCSFPSRRVGRVDFLNYGGFQQDRVGDPGEFLRFPDCQLDNLRFRLLDQAPEQLTTAQCSFRRRRRDSVFRASIRRDL